MFTTATLRATHAALVRAYGKTYTQCLPGKGATVPATWDQVFNATPECAGEFRFLEMFCEEDGNHADDVEVDVVRWQLLEEEEAA